MSTLTRKEFLKFGAALPLALGSLQLRAEEKKKEPPRRIIFICNSLGFYEPNFFPRTRGELGTSSYLKGLRTMEKMTVFENFFHPGMATSNHDSEKSFLTGAHGPESPAFVNSISLDQVLARELGGETRFPYLNFSIYDRGWGCSWNDRGSALPPMHDEVAIYNMLFGEEDLAVKRRQITNDRKVLACLHRDMESLRKSGAAPEKLADYTRVIRELEAQLEHESFWLKAKKPVVANPLSDDREFAFSTKIHNLLQLAKLAFQTDSTRVMTFSMDWIYGAIKVPGASGGWHTLSHHANKADALARLSHIEADIVRHLDQFLFELDQIPEGKGTLLDHTTVVIGSNFGDASNHTHNKLPTIVGGGGYRHQQHRVLDGPTPLCNLYLELLQHHNIDTGHFGSSERSMGLLAG